MSDAPSGSAGRLIHLLKLVASGPYYFALGDLAKRACLPNSSVHRLLQELLAQGLVERGPGQSYKPGRELHRIASQLIARFDLTRSAHPLLEELVDRWQETAVLCAYSPASRIAVIADVVQTPHPLRFSVDIGREIALPWGSLGRAILAQLSKGEIETIMRAAKEGPISGLPRSPRAEIGSDLEQIRLSGFSRYYNPEHDIAGISSPVFGAAGEVLGCLGVTMPSRRYQLHLEDDLAVEVRAAAAQLSELAAIAHG